MAVRDILTPPADVLRARAHKVRGTSPKLQELINDMIETMRAAPGVGLAAPQIGVGQRVIVVEYAEEPQDEESPPKPKKLYAVVNPEIVRHSAETVVANEACLSVPGYFGEVERFESVTVKGLNRQGRPFRMKADGWLARIFQHEIDHLDGILYIDRATNVWKVEEGTPAEAIPAD
jgi:peptide deformylase